MAVVRKCSCGQEYPKSFHIGQRFNISGGFPDEYLLCLVAGGDYNKVQLTNVDTGSLFHGNITVKDYNDITPEEFDQFFNMFDNYNIVCPKCRTPYVEVKTTYSIGQKFDICFYEKEGNTRYILASSEPYTAVLINLEKGTRFFEGIKVKDLYNITEEEMDLIKWGYKFELVEE